MRRSVVFSIMLIFVVGAIVFAQQGLQQNRPLRGQRMDRDGVRGRIWDRIPDLTDEQKDQLGKLQLDHLKAVKDLNNSLMEKRAVLHSLTTADKADMNKINAKIDEICKLQTEKMKEREKQHQAVRSVLTEEQRVVFDSMGPGMRGDRPGRGMRGQGMNGRGMRGPGPCFDPDN
jgi:Spy/CpxP family protein refolding chaperone